MTLISIIEFKHLRHLCSPRKTSNHQGFLPPTSKIWISHALPARRPRNLRLQGLLAKVVSKIKDPQIPGFSPFSQGFQLTTKSANSMTRRCFKPSGFGPRFALAFRRSFNLNRYTENRKTYNHHPPGSPCLSQMGDWCQEFFKTSQPITFRDVFSKNQRFGVFWRVPRFELHEILDTLRFKRDIGSLLADVFHSLHTLLI